MLKTFSFVLSVVFFLAGCSSPPAEILIASKPSGAAIFMDGVEVGKTPMKVAIDKKVALEIQKNNFITYQAVLSEKDGPNLLVTLEPANGSGASGSFSESNNAEGSFKTIAQLKHLYNTGQISRSNYDQRVRQVRSKMDMALRALRAKYNRGEISRSQYNQRSKQIKYKYQG